MRTIFSMLLATALCLTASVQAQTVAGVVVDNDGHPIVGVSVITNASGVGTLTDDDGDFSLKLRDDITRLTFSSVGYESRQFAIGNVPDTIVLESRFYRSEDILVTADRAEEGVTPISFENVTQDELERDYTIGDLPLLLNTTPNYYSFADGGGDMGYTYSQIRGFDDRRIRTYLNGIPLNDPEDQYTYWVDIPDFVNSVHDVQIQRGVGNSLYGDASFGGSVNVVTSTLNQPSTARIAAGYGEYLSDGNTVGKSYRQTYEYHSGLIEGQWAFSGRFSKTRSDGYREQAWTDSWAYYLAAARLDPNMTTEVQIFGGPTNLHLTFLGASRDVLEQNRRFNPLQYGDETDNFSQPHYHIHNTLRLNDNTTLRNTVYYIRGTGYFEQFKGNALYENFNLDPSQTGGATNGDLVVQQSVEKWQLGWNPRLDVEHNRGRHALGGSLYYFTSDHFGEVTWARNITDSIDTRFKYYQYYGKKWVGSIYGQEYYRLTDRFSVQATAQFRYETYDFDQDRLGVFPGYFFDIDWFFFSPRLGVNYLLVDEPGRRESNLYANFAIASRPPTDATVYDATVPGLEPSLEIQDTIVTAGGNPLPTFGDPTFEEERVYNLELGGNYRTPWYNVGVNFYWMDFDNEIIPFGGISDLGQVITINAEGSHRLGIEMSGGVRPHKDVSLSATLSLNRYRIDDFSTTLTVYDAAFDRAGDTLIKLEDVNGLAFPDVLGSFIATYSPGDLALTYRLRGVGKQYMEVLNIDSLAIDAYSVSSLTATYTLRDFVNLGDLTVSATVDNIFDAEYLTSGYGWNYGVDDGSGIALLGGAEYYVGSERSFWTEISLNLF